jgi:hypothetical protein
MGFDNPLMFSRDIFTNSAMVFLSGPLGMLFATPTATTFAFTLPLSFATFAFAALFALLSTTASAGLLVLFVVPRGLAITTITKSSTVVIKVRLIIAVMLAEVTDKIY